MALHISVLLNYKQVKEPLQNSTPQKNLALAVGLFALLLLVMVQLKPGRPIMLAERFIPNTGWIEVLVLASYGAFIAYKMYPIKQTPVWRVRIWNWFSVIFFAQLGFGLLGIDDCLMSGNLHFPIPAMIVAGPAYRGELSVMTFIFISTLLLSGPAWCSQLCYFGAIDALAANGKTNRKPIAYKQMRHFILLITIVVAITLRFLGIGGWLPVVLIVTFGLVAFVVMALLSRKQHKMVHCTVYCPIGTVVAYYGKWVSPIKITINNHCTNCMMCIPMCKYDALQNTDIINRKAGFGCTTCGDCLSACHTNAIEYHSRWLSAETTRWLYLFVTISLHVLFMATARI
jgi:ferredoxin-type protein NapH